ncbi:MAG TPA: N-acetylmuramoyl-L-alanine amidase [Bryobacteraceae bacterium]|nr:N-acetylmuramoyl-L-alanine amidase [Bryobacteraceae bacterium]
MPHLPREHSHVRPSRQVSRVLLTLVAGAALVFAESDATHRVTAVRFWSLGELTRVAIETDGDFEVASDHLSNPERIFFDLKGTRPALGKRVLTVIPVGDKLIQQIRVAEPRTNVTRVVLDLTGPAQASTSRLENPNRLIIEVRQSSGAGENAAIEVSSVPATVEQPKVAERRSFSPPPRAPALDSTKGQIALVEPPVVETPASGPAGLNAKVATATYRNISPPPPVPPVTVAKVSSNPMPPLEAVAKRSIATSVDTPAVKRTPTALAPETALPAKRNSTGDRSMVRVLGLKIGRIVLDPGHGGHDTGTVGPEGLREKDLVLDVAKRLGALIEDRMGSEVIFTRSDDTFIPLERRTEIANEAKADLFLSIHANSSPVRSAAGVETYYLSFTTSKAALDLAARENAGSQETVYDLQDLLQKIALNDKIGESRDFAGRVQTALFSLSAKSNSHAKDRGVRKAPFVVLIGANMPSVLAEVGFISNAHDESTMKRPEYRQRIAEALYKGLSGYASTLSHFQLAQRSATSTQ